MRGQTSLPALGVALVLLVVTTLFALTVAGGQLSAADRSPVERTTAQAVADRLVAADSAMTTRENVLRAGFLSGLTAGDLRDRYGLDDRAAASVSLDGEEVLATGDATGGSTVERIVLVENRTERTLRPRFADARSVTLPRRTPTVAVEVAPSGSAGVQVVRVNDAVVLRDPGGLDGRYEVDVSRYETVTISFEGTVGLSVGDVTVDYRPARTRKAALRVTVARWGDPGG